MERSRSRVFCTQKMISCYLPVHKDMAEEDLDLYFIPVPLVSTSKDAGRQDNCSSGS